MPQDEGDALRARAASPSDLSPASGSSQSGIPIAVLDALLAVVAATRAYLPPDGISAQECINRVLAATDNPTITPIILEAENGRS